MNMTECQQLQLGNLVVYQGEQWSVKELFLDDPTDPWISLTWADFPSGPVVMTLDPRLTERAEVGNEL